ncbi:response regulator transcription factor [Paenibacillus mucilaginosus]|uniref:Heme response regulator HssR n=3 Tax=Paenibacillus mucilaginosus TaxID=61624 RepID=H6NH10_9BACL|nr:response regulator transcription factor [Paenibacillus mucilaginosus]AEI40029.1 two-component response regulator [Paenibacillus mucilaginosus KNP414]AFC28688.1 two-component response regulator [Paenibacillus mucilaginosus 3016]AFH60865.1 heme response regulator HssR [Paenibacillus mucilaginosus K02]WDM29277.1 response regulator transcription factor [Paenibacillus mucilaginosus]WFA17466.1 response regulator transcription factor [Paenibacillus mucilaginosus]
MITILLVDDDNHIRELMKLSLREEGYRLIEAGDGQAALHCLEEVQVHLVVLDVMMPRMDGFELCRQIRRKYNDLPVLMVTAKGETGDKVEGFQLGADDYLVKPFDPRELIMRVKSLLRRYKLAGSDRIQLGRVELDKKGYEVIRGQEHLTLPLKEFELLHMLASHPNQILTRNQLIEGIWGLDYEGDDRTVDVHIKRLRERFKGEEEGFVIKTIRGLGYKLEVKA